MSALTHIDEQGNAVMVDVSGKEMTARSAVAAGHISMSGPCFALVAQGRMKKGDVLGVAQVAGIMAAKRTSELIPLCHPVQTTHCSVEFAMLPEKHQIAASCTVRCQGQTGVEMEALTGVSAALLTIYDMCKAADKGMVISDIHLVEKRGGQSGTFRFEDADHV